MNRIKVPVLLGPTAVGKTAIALQIAQAGGFEIISCDSRQIYKGMDIGTAKPDAAARAQVVHHCIDIIEPSEIFSAAQFAAMAAGLIRQAHAHGKRVLICGGTGFYFKALESGLGAGVGADAAVREQLLHKLSESGPAALYAELQEKDPQAAARIHPHNHVRVMRALEVLYTTGKPFSQFTTDTRAPQDFEFNITIIMEERSVLYKRINERVDLMQKAGLWEEFCALRKRGFHESSPGMLSPGYRELFSVERGEMALLSALDKVKQNTRHYAKRQITWFTHQIPDSQACMVKPDYDMIKKRIADFGF